MSKPFIHLVRERGLSTSDAELVEQAFSRMTRWSMLSGGKQVSLDEVAWLGAVLFKSQVAAGVATTETRDENGARVVGAVASDGVRVVDGAA